MTDRDDTGTDDTGTDDTGSTDFGGSDADSTDRGGTGMGGGEPVGSVRPLDEAGTPLDTVPASIPSRRSPWVVVAGAAAAVLLIGVVGGWLWWVNVIRGPLGAAEVLPGSADMVVTIDALELIEGDRFARIVRAFDPDGGFDLDELIAEIDDGVEEEIGLRVFEDVRAWIGRTAAVAVWAPADFLETFDAEPEIAIAVMTRNEGAARQFIDDVVASARSDGAEIEIITIAGVDVYSVASETTPALVTVHSGRVLLANDPGRLAEMIEPTDPITERSAYDRLWTAADGDAAFASLYVSENFIDEIASGVAETGGVATGDLPSGAVLAVATLDDDGVQFSAASITLDDSGEAVSGTWARDLPAGTYGYVSLALPDEAQIAEFFDSQVDAARDAGAVREVDELLDGFEDIFGLSLRDLVTQFGGEMLFAAVQSDFGPMPALAGGPLGIGFAIGVEDAAVVEGALADIPEALGPDGDIITRADDGFWAVDLGDGEIVRYGVTDSRLIVASDPVTVDGLAGRSGGGLTDDAGWQRLAGLIGEDMVMYVDFARIFSAFAPPDVAADLVPLRSMGASTDVADGVSVVRVRIVIDY